MSDRTSARIEIFSIVSRDPEVHGGDIVFEGTRVPVSILIDYLKGGSSIDEFIEGYPGVERSQAEALLDIALEAVEEMAARRAPSR